MPGGGGELRAGCGHMLGCPNCGACRMPRAHLSSQAARLGRWMGGTAWGWTGVCVVGALRATWVAGMLAVVLVPRVPACVSLATCHVCAPVLWNMAWCVRGGVRCLSRASSL